MPRRPADLLHAGLLGLFLVSGTCGLVHEVAWTRLLRRVLGNTTDAITIVLCVFMAGLALGSLLFGRVLLRRRPPLLVFAGLEGLVGLYCLALPALVEAGTPLYGALYSGSTSDLGFVAARLAFAALVLAVPAILMGGTLPVLSRFVASAGVSLGRAAGTLYGANTLGAVLGASLGAFLFVPTFGVSGAIRAAAGLNLLVAVLAVVLHRRSRVAAPAAAAPVEPDRGSPPAGAAPRARTVVLVGYGVAGAAALVYEVGWTRALSLLVGSSVYAFGLMLTAFVLGLALGSLFAARFADRVERPFVWLAGLQAGIAAAGFAVVPLFDALPFHVTGWLAAARDSFWQVQAVTFLLFLLVMLVPTLLMGAMFPLASRVAGGGASGDAAGTVGTVYAANTFGAIVGAATGGFVLVPWLGVRGALLAAVATNVAVFALFAEAAGAGWRRRRTAAAVGLAAGLVLLVAAPGWDPARTATGAFANARRLPRSVAGSPEQLARTARQAKIVFHEDGRDTTVTVLETPDGERILSVNGKPDASSRADLSTQLLLGHVPMLLHEDPDDVLVIGLASGITLAAAAKHDARSLQCAEISPAVVRASRMFDEANDHVLEDERVEVLTADGRNHLTFTDRTYDVVISEPSNPWIAGIGDLFTLEFFRIVSDRLNEGGVACIWVETYNIDEESLRAVVRTFLEVFPNGALWNIGPFDFELIGVKGPHVVDAAALAARAEREAVGDDLLRIDIESVAELLARQVCGPETLGEFARGAPLHTDDNALLEFRAPRILFSNRGEVDLLERIEELRTPWFDWLSGPDAAPLRGAAAQATAAEGRRRRAEIHLLRARSLGADGSPAAMDRMRDELRRAAELAPDHPDVVRQLEEGLKQATAYETQGRTALAITTYRRLVSVFPDHPRPANDLAWLLATHPNDRFRDAAEAVRLAELAVTKTSERSANELDTLAAAYAEDGRFADARTAISKAVALARAEGRPQALAAFEAHRETIRRGEPIRSGGP